MAFDETALEEKIQAKMDDIEMADVDENEELEVEETAEEQTADTEETDDPTPDAGDQADESEEAESSTSEESSDNGAEEAGLPDAYYRAALHQQWTPDEIKNLYEQDPALAEKTFKKLYDDTNRLTSEFAALGRAKLKQPEVKEEVTKPVKANIDLTALKEQYGEDSAMVMTVEALANLVAQPHAEPEPAKQVQAPVIDAATRQLVDNFFSAEPMKLYGEFYGASTDTNKLTQEQIKHRLDVLNRADEIIAGAEAVGRELSEEQALEAAHLLVSEPLREEVIRKGILKQVKKRGNGITLKPSGNKPAVDTGKPATMQEVEARTEERLAKLKW